MTARIEPGIYTDMSSVDYHADPCPAPSLTQSIAKVLLIRSPLHAWHAHPRLNPDYQHDDATKFDVGNVAHKMLIGRGKEIAVLEGFDDWRTNAAKEARAKAAAVGKIAVLGKTAARASKMVEAAREQLELRGLGNLFADGLGNGEVVTAWREDDIWLRQAIDWLSSDLLTFVDFKTTDMSAAPHGLDRMMVNAGWHIQAAMGERGLETLAPHTAGRRRYLFVVQEAEKPYALSVAAITEAALTIGRKMLDRAADIWRDCIASDRWPGYPMGITAPQIPGWYEAAAMEQDIEHYERRQREAIPSDIIMAG